MFRIRGVLGIRVFSIFVFMVGALNIFVGITTPGCGVFLVLGIISALLALGIFSLSNWARIGMIVFSVSFILLFYFPMILGTVLGHLEYAGFIGLILNSPIFLLSLLCIDSFLRPEVKQHFLKNNVSKKLE